MGIKYDPILNSMVSVDDNIAKILFAQQLPTENIEENVVYIVPNPESDDPLNSHNEYIYKENNWELYGTTSISNMIGVKFNGNRTIKRSGIPNVNVGTTTNVADFLEQFFFPFIPATLSLNGFSLYEVGNVVTPTLTGTLALNDETVVNSRIVQMNGSDTDVFTGTSISKVMPSATTNTTYRLKANVANNGSAIDIYSSTQTLSFIYPFFYGCNANASLTGSDVYSVLTKSITNKANKSITYSGTDTYLYFAYPASYGNIVKVMDPNNFDVTSAFTKSVVNVSSSGLTNNWSLDYNVYRSNLTSANGVFVFSF